MRKKLFFISQVLLHNPDLLLRQPIKLVHKLVILANLSPSPVDKSTGSDMQAL
jgi:hypothetical protein